MSGLLGFQVGLTNLRAACFHPVHPIGKVVCERDGFRTDHVMEGRPTWAEQAQETETERRRYIRGLECNFK